MAKHSPQQAFAAQPSLNHLSPADIPGGEGILNAVKGKHASQNVVMHGLYGFYFNRKSIRTMTKM